MGASYVAVDLGASSGRVILGTVGDDRLELEVLHRFGNDPRSEDGHLRWDVRALRAGIIAGLAALPNGGRCVRSVGVDTWGVDYGLLDEDGELVEDPVAYRDGRTDGVPQRVSEVVPHGELFAATGLQVQPINTLYQLFAHVHDGSWPERAVKLLMMPDVFHSSLCGSTVGEYTNATTSQLVDVGTGTWNAKLFERLGLPLGVMPDLVPPGTELGELLPDVRAEAGAPALRVVAPATHDTASAVVGTPLREGWAYISSGTWSLVGIETPAPLLTDAVAADNLTNEGGAFGTNRLLKNVMGLWILESCRAQWAAQPFDELLRDVERAPPFSAFIQPDDPRFLHPQDMVAAVASYLAETHQSTPATRAGLARVILESLALRYATVLRAIERVTGESLRGVHIIGGGSQNDFLNQATADATGLEVLAGPVEATALGNLLVQAIADGQLAGLAEARAHIAKIIEPRRFAPAASPAWQDALGRYLELP